MAERPRLSLEQLNLLDRAGFTAALGHLFEHTPFIAERTWAAHPFGSVAKLQQALIAQMDTLSPTEQLSLIQAHPELAGRAEIAGSLTAESRSEQSSARLDQMSPAEFERFQQLNATYGARFGFPFIICVREHTRSSILAAFEQRIQHDREAEIATALEEIGKIASLRLADLIAI